MKSLRSAQSLTPLQSKSPDLWVGQDFVGIWEIPGVIGVPGFVGAAIQKPEIHENIIPGGGHVEPAGHLPLFVK